MRRLAPILAAVSLAVLPALVIAHPLPGASSSLSHARHPASPAHATLGSSGCPMFPADNPWNQRVDRLPVANNSATLIASIGLDAPVHPDFGSGLYNGEPIGIPFAIVSKHTRRVPVSFQYASESDGRFYPLPRGVAIEGGYGSSGDRHVIVVDRDSCRDYELYAAYPHANGSCSPARRPASPDRAAHESSSCWSAGSGAIFDLRSNHLRPAGWTSADAAGLPILPGLARYDEVARGVIDHALRFTAPDTRTKYVYPARHFASSSSDPSLPPMGLRVRLKANVDISHLPYQARVVAQALKRYGLILADNGSPWYISGAPDRHWNNDALHLLDQLSGRSFEVVDTRSLPHPGS